MAYRFQDYRKDRKLSGLVRHMRLRTGSRWSWSCFTMIFCIVNVFVTGCSYDKTLDDTDAGSDSSTVDDADGSVTDEDHDVINEMDYKDSGTNITDDEGSSDQNPPAEVPQEFSALYEYLEHALSDWNDYLDQRWDNTLSPVKFGAMLVPANSNLGPGLLEPGMLDFTKQYIQRLKSLGCSCVQMDIQFPVLDQNYYTYLIETGQMSASDPGRDSYLAYYQQVADEIKSQGLVLSVESQVTFLDDTWSTMPVEGYYQTFVEAPDGFEQYQARRLAMLQLIATELQPDYFSIVNEPETEMELCGIPELYANTANYLSMLQEFIESLRPVLPENLLLGGGFGSWSRSWEQWSQAMNQMDLDFINIHAYSIDIFPQEPSDNIVPRILQIATQASEAGKGVVLGESWLYKMGPTDSADPVIIYGRDYFSFWAPLDQRFIQLMMKFAHLKELDYISFFWSGFFFSYLEYDQETSDMTTAERKRTNNQSVFENVNRNRYSSTGRAYEFMIEDGPNAL